MAENESQLDRIERKLDTLCKIITGNDNPGEGLVVRFDRVEQAQKRVRWYIRTIVAALVAAILFGIVAGIVAAMKGS